MLVDGNRIRYRAPASVLALVTCGALALMGVAPSALGATDRKPDLVVTRTEYVGPAYAVQGKNVTLGFKDKTENQGNATAGASRTGMLLAPMNTRHHVAPVKLGSRGVPKLHPGDASSGAGSEGVSTDLLPLGAYKVKVCADVNRKIGERKEGNNCKRAGHFYVVKDVWFGSTPHGVEGVGPIGSTARAETWSGGGYLALGQYLGGGVFRYDYTGDGTWTDHGVTTGGCQISGGRTKQFHDAPGIKLDYLGGTYHGVVRTEGFYEISFTPPPQGSEFCPSPFTTTGPATREFLDTGKDEDLFFDQNQLTGTYNKNGGAGSASGVTYTWDF